MSGPPHLAIMIVIALVSSYVTACIVYQEKRPVLGCESALKEAREGGIMLCVFLLVAFWVMGPW
jgi:hypothetical protein